MVHNGRRHSLGLELSLRCRQVPESAAWVLVIGERRRGKTTIPGQRGAQVVHRGFAAFPPFFVPKSIERDRSWAIGLRWAAQVWVYWRAGPDNAGYGLGIGFAPGAMRSFAGVEASGVGA